MNFNDIRHEHLSYYSLDALKKLMEKERSRRRRRLHQRGERRQLARIRRAHGQQARRHRSGTAQSRRARRHGARAEIGSGADLPGLFQQIQDLAGRVNKFLEQEIQGGGKVFGLGASTRATYCCSSSASPRSGCPISASAIRTKWACARWAPISSLSRSSGLATFAPAPWWFCRGTSKRKSWTASRIISGKAKLLFPMPYAHVVTKDREITL